MTFRPDDFSIGFLNGVLQKLNLHLLMSVGIGRY